MKSGATHGRCLGARCSQVKGRQGGEIQKLDGFIFMDASEGGAALVEQEDAQPWRKQPALLRFLSFPDESAAKVKMSLANLGLLPSTDIVNIVLLLSKVTPLHGWICLFPSDLEEQ